MSPRSLTLEIIAVLSGTIIGKLVFDGVSALFFDDSFFDLFISPGRWIVALATVVLFSIIYQKLPATPAALACLLVGTVITWTFFGLAFESGHSTVVLIFMTLLFSAIALLTYRFVHANAAVRRVASDMTGSAEGEDAPLGGGRKDGRSED
ncbi:hypothetical protein FP2506_17079 [Fulvimarina pelagi HTCC2506]|uniref:Uncharacterized protein n=1 Tax=Fulvimarina pelagi HTCC2506 TaxID=314231 RepID=Q0G2L4_9HYPH|nr:hypothetical protein [Fulvimarina pelagi]EAU42167.1 hypothetical protein FP2506_17079 [Fulvimarina pelagi HTCC2506]